VDNTLDLQVRVKPAWYQTAWFYLALALAGAGAVTALVRSRTAYLRSRQKRLEQLVIERTASLAEANSALARRTDQLERKTQQVTDLLDNSGEGFFSFDTSLLVGDEYSRACETMLGTSPAGKPVDQVLLAADPQRAATFRQVITSAFAITASWKRSLMLSLLPNTLDRGALRLRADYKDLGGNRIMVVLTDVTEEQRLAAKVETEHRHLAMTVAAVAEGRDFFDLLAAFRAFWRVELGQLLASSARPTAILQDLYRAVHTFKGSLSQFHFLDAPSTLHDLETDLSTLRFRGEDLEIGELTSLVATIEWETLLDTDLAPLRQILGEEFFAEGLQLKLSAERASQMLTTAESLLDLGLPDIARAHLERLVDDLRALNHLNLAEAIAAFDRVVSQTAKRLEKAAAPLLIEGETDIWVAPERYNPFLRSLTHVFRNAIAHGIETPEQRLRSGKPMEGTVSVVIERGTDWIRLTISDDGAGLDLDALRKKAIDLGLYHENEAEALAEPDLIELIFADAVSTQETFDEIAGRGVGLAAVRAEVTAIGGKVAVKTRRGEGTSFVFTLPDNKSRHQPAYQMGDVDA
jgi:two-component system chemotaxis sensor kinase CheA